MCTMRWNMLEYAEVPSEFHLQQLTKTDSGWRRLTRFDDAKSSAAQTFKQDDIDVFTGSNIGCFCGQNDDAIGFRHGTQNT